MTPAQTLIAQLKNSGVTLRLDGDAIVHRGPRTVLIPDVIAQLRQLKPEIVLELQREAGLGSPCLLRFAGNGCEPKKVDRGGVGHSSWHAESLRCQIVADLDRLSAPRDHSGRRLIAETRKFLESPWLPKALECGWSLEELFGLDESKPLDNYEHWGLVVGLALAPRCGDVIEHLDAEHAVIRYFAGAPLKNARRIERRFTPIESAVPWWECAGLMGDFEQLTV